MYDDIIDGICSEISKKPKIDYLYNIYNIGNSKPLNLSN